MSQTDWHYPRPLLAEKYLNLFDIGLTSARGLFARRRMGKTEFLKKDFIPAAQKKGYVVVYTNLWELEVDPATALVSELYKMIEPKGFARIWASLNTPINIKKVKASGKVPGFGEGAVEADLSDPKKLTGTLLMEAMSAYDNKKTKMVLVIDEAQVLAYEENSHFAHALRAALDIRKDTIKVIFAGSSETTLRRMFGVASEPFYNWAPLEPFELLGREFVAAMVERVNKISKFQLSLNEAIDAFENLKSTPEFFRRYIEYYLSNPEEGSNTALEYTKNKVFSDKNFKRQWDLLLPADKVILSMIAHEIGDLHSQLALKKIGESLGIGNNVNKNTTQNALRRLANKNLITKVEYGTYQFEDEAFADWVKHLDGEVD
ncbi:hypothetical protein [Legionella sainthelensi]|uniref:hypothetical protein n=1 Tax=Legionella sainthelensi TaxID=28087 RepID=UPI000EF2A340|nr:hypothetical protein [Legionella sainthelensi]AYK03147.1 hypothetical protein CAB17_20210 [Legionella sainthelensi]